LFFVLSAALEAIWISLSRELKKTRIMPMTELGEQHYEE